MNDVEMEDHGNGNASIKIPSIVIPSIHVKPRKSENTAEAFQECCARLAGRGFAALVN